jgi:uncharacterized membrane protein (DUF485 family)
MGRYKYDWTAIAADPKFRALHRRKTRFLTTLMLCSIAGYLLLPVGAAYCPELFARRVLGEVNVGILVALLEFVVAWGVAVLYTRRANADFDRMAREIAGDAVIHYATRAR